MKIRFEDLDVWQKAHKFTLRIYKLTRLFPDDERFGLISQLRRSAVSIENNIAEGFGRRTTKDYICFLYHSHGSILETFSSMRIGHDLDYFDNKVYQDLYHHLQSIEMMLKKLIVSLSKKPPVT